MSQNGVDNKESLTYFCSYLELNNFGDGISENLNQD